LGGFLVKVNDDSLIYFKLITNKKVKVDFQNVKKIWIGNVYNVKNDIVSLIASKKQKTPFPVKVGKIPIYYASDKYDYNRYICTEKYRIMKKWYDMFGSSNND